MPRISLFDFFYIHIFSTNFGISNCINRFQIARMRTIVHDIDEKAFISITEVSDLFGKDAK